jgi:hypothetical protein
MNDPAKEEVTRDDGIHGKHSWKSCYALRSISDHSLRDISANSPYNDTEKEKKELIILLTFRIIPVAIRDLRPTNG